ncbi:MAG: VCBS repeat-containing protein [Rhodocyclaceae bacterium]|nr:VCBS repeat-containing protein [Rhodocyclaceae bacterium]
MKISASEISMQSEHSSVSIYSRMESLRAWKGSPAGSANPAPRTPTPQVLLSDKGVAIQAAAANGEEAQLDPKIKLLIAMIEAITGKPVKFFNQASLAQPPAAGNSAPASATPPSAADWGMTYDLHESYTEAEQTTVSSSGTIKTADGKTVSFQLDLSMSRSYYESTDISVRAGNAQRKDPLVINFDGTAAQLSDMKFSFDLNGDGKEESISQLAGGSGYLALDKNGDGKINNGTELFGPTTNNGFGELARLDGDRNGWIDENDAAFEQLKIWVPGADGGKLMSLKEAGVGALALAHINSQFELRGQGNSNLGGIRDTGVFLFEDGRVGSMQEIDLTV